jgi:hypothetical protein
MESFWKSFIEQKRKFQQIQPLNKISNLQQKSRINKLCLPLYPNSQVKTPNSNIEDTYDPNHASS